MKTSTKALYWTARILCILAILFVSLFSLDSFSSERTFWQNTTAFLMHNIPSFILLAITYHCMEMGKSRWNNIDHCRISI